MKKFIKGAVVASLGIAAAAAANSAIFSRARALTNRLGGEGRFWSGPHGDLFYAKQGKGAPLVLLHGIYAGASAYEWRRNFDALSEHYTVYAPDWLGFGLSDKPGLDLTSKKHIESLEAFLNNVVKEPCALVASSLGAAYAVQAAVDLPDLVKVLVLVCPTGISTLASGQTSRSAAAFKLMALPGVVTTIWNCATSTASLRHYLMNYVYFDPSYVDDTMVDQYFTSTHQFGSQYAFPPFVTGLQNHNVNDVFPKLMQSTLRIVWGREARVTPLDEAERFLTANPNAELTVFDKSGMLPHDEQAQGFNRLVIELLQSNDAFHTSHNGANKVPKRTKKETQETG